MAILFIILNKWKLCSLVSHFHSLFGLDLVVSNPLQDCVQIRNKAHITYESCHNTPITKADCQNVFLLQSLMLDNPPTFMKEMFIS